MSALKRKNISSLINTNESQTNTAAFLPLAMASLSPNGDIHSISIDKLSNAPSEWNFYRPLDDSKMLELIDSIKTNGLLHPIVIWKKENDYIILSGHNRTEAYKRLLMATKDPQYETIPCIVKTGISPLTAREIIIDSNWISRNLSVSEKTKSIYHKYAVLSSNKKMRNGKTTYDAVAESYGLSGRQIHRYLKLADLVEEMTVLIDNGILSLRSGVILSDLSLEIQNKLIANYKEVLTNQLVSKIKKDMSYEEIEIIIKTNRAEKINDSSENVTLTFSVPKDQASNIKTLIEELIKNSASK